MTTLQLNQPRSDCLPDLTDYWLRHCQGFHVFGPDGRVGFVEAVDEVGDHVDLVIAAGLFRHRTLVAHDRDVDELDVASRRVRVTGSERWDERRPRRWSVPGSIETNAR